MQQQFSAAGKTVTLFSNTAAPAPVVWLNTVQGEGGAIWQACQADGCPAFALAAVSQLAWDHDMSPWPIPPIAEGDTPCTGGADDYLCLLTERLLPAAADALPFRPQQHIIAGYSLAGLFAVYALYRTDVFSKAASASGSLWYPGLLEYTQQNAFMRKPESVYFSLGDREAHTGNRFLASVEDNTRRIQTDFRAQGIETTFVLNRGNHYQHAAARMAAGIRWILEH